MDPNRLTQKSQEALQAAQSIAVRRGHQEVDGLHLLMALCEQQGGLVPRLLEKLKRPVDVVIAEIIKVQTLPQAGIAVEDGRINTVY